MSYSEFGKRLSNLRKSRGLSQYRLAEMCGITDRTISNYERSVRAPMNMAYLHKIAKALNVPVSTLLGEDPAPKDRVQGVLTELSCLFGDGLLSEKQKIDLMRNINDVYFKATSVDRN